MKVIIKCYFTAGTILNDTIYIKKNNLNTHYKNLGISANVNLASRNINTSEPYHHYMNPIEKFFNQLKYYMKRDEPMSYDLIKKSIRKSIKYIELKTYKNYFKSSLTKTKEDIKEIKMKYRKKAKIYKE